MTSPSLKLSSTKKVSSISKERSSDANNTSKDDGRGNGHHFLLRVTEFCDDFDRSGHGKDVRENTLEDLK